MKLRHKIDENILEKKKTCTGVQNRENMIYTGNHLREYLHRLSLYSYIINPSWVHQKFLLPADMQALLKEAFMKKKDEHFGR